MAGIRFLPTGVEASSFAEILSAIEADIRSRIGDDLSLDPETVQGQYNAIVALALAELYEVVTQIANANSVDVATGVWLRALGQQLGIERLRGTRSSVIVIVTGVAGTTIPVGSRATTTAGAIFETVRELVITPGGVLAEMRATEDGPIAAAAGTLTSITTIIPGWETVTNPADAVLGLAEQTEEQYRAELRARTARSSIGPEDALRAAITEARATKSEVIVNDSHLAVTRQGWSLPPNSVLVLVEGGTDADLRRAIVTHKGMGVQLVTAITGGDPNETALAAVSDGTVTFGGIAYENLDLSSTTTATERAAALETLITHELFRSAHVEWPSDPYYVVVMRWDPSGVPAFADQTVETAFGLDASTAVDPLGPFVRPRARPLTVVADITVRAGFPADGLAQLRQAAIDAVDAYRIGETPYANDVLCALERIAGTNVTSLTLRDGTRDVSGVEPPLDARWTLPAANVTLNLTS